MELKKDERIDDLEYKGLKIIQNQKGFCFGMDSVLISDFARDIKNNSVGVDLGTGTGIISILLSAKTNLSKIIGVEVQKDVADMARRSVLLNKLQNKIEIVNLNLKAIKEKKNIESLLKKDSFDFVVTNPPYKKLDTGKINENEYRYISRHEITANLEDFIQVTNFLLKDRGKIYLVHRPERLVDIMQLMRKYKLEPKRIRFVYPSINKEPNLVLISGVKNARPFLKIDNPLFVYENGKYTDEILKIYNKKSDL